MKVARISYPYRLLYYLTISKKGEDNKGYNYAVVACQNLDTVIQY